MNPSPERIGGFEIIERIGGRQTCDVYKGYDASLDRYVAVRVLKPELAENQELVDRFHREATVTAQVPHPNVVPVHFIGQEGDCHFFVMQYIRGQTLASRLAGTAPLPLEEAVGIARQCLCGLEAAHRQGLVHGEVSPDNVLLEQETGRAVLIDFGRVRWRNGDTQATSGETIEATSQYTAPEQAGGEPASARTDLYCLGVLFYQMLAGRLPIVDGRAAASSGQRTAGAPAALSEIAPDVPAPIRRVVQRLMAPDPAGRYADCSEALQELNACAIGGSPAASPSEAMPGTARERRPSSSIFSWLPVPRRRVTRRHIELVLLAGVLVGLLVGQRAYMAVNKKRAMAAHDRLAQMVERPTDLVELPLANLPSKPPADLMAECLVYLTFEPDTVQKQEDMFLVKDLSGHDNHGVLFGPMLTDQGKVGHAVRFQGNLESVSLPTLSSDAVRNAKPVSLSLWVNEVRYQRTAHLFQASDGISVVRSANDRSFTFKTPWPPTEVRVKEIRAEVWHHVVGVWDGRANKIYVDGHLAEEKSLTSPALWRPEKGRGFYAASLGGSLTFGDVAIDGLVDEVMIFGRALFAEEVRQLYQMGQEGKRPAPPAPAPPLSGFLAELKKKSAEESRDFDLRLQKVVEERKALPAKKDRSRENVGYARTSDGEVLLVGHCYGWIIQREQFGASKTMGRGQPPGYGLRGLVISPDDRCAACFGPTGEVFMWDIAAKKATKTIVTPLKAVLCVAFSADGRHLIVSGRGGTSSGPVGIWETDTGKQLAWLKVPQRNVAAVAYSREGDRILAATMDDNRFYLFDAAQRKEIRNFPGHTATATCVQFLPGAKQALSGGGDNLLRLWDLEKGEQICALKAHLAAVTCLAVSPDGRYAVSGSRDMSARIWDLRRRKKIDDFGPLSDPVCYVACEQDPWFMSVGVTDGNFYDIGMPISEMRLPQKSPRQKQ